MMISQFTKRAIVFFLVLFISHPTGKAFTATTTIKNTNKNHHVPPRGRPSQQPTAVSLVPHQQVVTYHPPGRRTKSLLHLGNGPLQPLTKNKYSYTRSRPSIMTLYAKPQESSSLMDNIVSAVVGQTKSERTRIQMVTLIRVGVPSVLSGIAAFFAFPALALFLASIVNDAGVFAVLSQDSSQFVQNFLTVSGLLFSILIGQTYAFLYTQQEAVFYALFNEVTEAKSLLEQVALVCQGRSMYGRVLESICKYVQNDLKQLKADPAVLISARPIDDPLEAIMYLTSVGVPSSVYETVRSLRQARAARLGALQRKLPKVHFVLLWILALIELVRFRFWVQGLRHLVGIIY
jgi:hypothetical protein